MQRLTYKTLGLFAAASALVLGAAGCPGGEEGPGGLAGDLAEQCGLTCAADGIVEGNASISGLRSVDAFFQSVISLKNATASVRADVDAIKGKIAASVGLEAGATGAELEAAIKAKIDANVSGGLKVSATEPKCEASVEVAVEASARCDAEIDPGSAKVECMGSCTVEASAAADCDASAEVVCTGTAPALACSGTCKGECKFDAAASCEGKCMGGCQGSCEVQVAGTCEGMCNGTCDGDTMNGGQCSGMCEGKCEIDGSAECGGSCSGECMAGCMADVDGGCSGSCEGECEYTPPMATCSANASVQCKATASAMAECSGKCEGEINPPKAKAECEASAKAEANASVQCTPPSLEVKFEFAAGVAGDAQAEAEFRAWLEGFKGHLSALLALEARAKLLVNATADVGVAAKGAVTGALDDLKGDADLKASIGAACALPEVGKVGGVLDGAVADMMASVDAVASISAGAGL